MDQGLYRWVQFYIIMRNRPTESNHPTDYCLTQIFIIQVRVFGIPVYERGVRVSPSEGSLGESLPEPDHEPERPVKPVEIPNGPDGPVDPWAMEAPYSIDFAPPLVSRIMKSNGNSFASCQMCTSTQINQLINQLNISIPRYWSSD